MKAYYYFLQLVIYILLIVFPFFVIYFSTDPILDYLEKIGVYDPPGNWFFNNGKNTDLMLIVPLVLLILSSLAAIALGVFYHKKIRKKMRDHFFQD